MPSKMTAAKKQAKKTRQATRPPRIRGKGNYFTDFVDRGNNKTAPPSSANKVARMAGEALGSGLSLIPGLGKLIPAPLISAASSALGDAGSWLSRAFGFGRYDVRRNSLYRNPSRIRGGPGGAQVEEAPYVASPPQFGSTKKGSDIVFAHREFITDVKSSINFKSQTFPINPGNPQMFPWMSRVAGLFEEYEMLGCLFEYRSTSATAVGTTSSGMGVVVMATDYDCYDSNYTSKRQMEAAEFSSAAVPYETFLHPIECDRSRNVLATEYVVPGITNSATAPGDQRLSVMGNFTIATEGQQLDDTTIGELWVTYHVRLSRPILESTSTNTVFTSNLKAFAQDTGNITAATQVVSGGLPGFGLSQFGTGSTARMRFDNTVNKVTSKFILTWSTRFVGTTSPVSPTNFMPSFGGSAAAYNIYAPYTDTTAASWNNSWNVGPVGETLTDYIFTTCFEFKAAGDWIEIPVLHSSSTLGFVSCVITQIAPNLNFVSSPAAATIGRPVLEAEDFSAAAAAANNTPGSWEENDAENDLYQKMIEKQRAAAYVRPASNSNKK